MKKLGQHLRRWQMVFDGVTLVQTAAIRERDIYEMLRTVG